MNTVEKWVNMAKGMADLQETATKYHSILDISAWCICGGVVEHHTDQLTGTAIDVKCDTCKRLYTLKWVYEVTP